MDDTEGHVEAIRVTNLRNLRDSGWLEIQPIQALPQRRRVISRVITDLQGCEFNLPGEQAVDSVEDMSETRTVLRFRCRLQPGQQSSLRPTLADLGLLGLEGEMAGCQAVLLLTLRDAPSRQRLLLQTCELLDENDDLLLRASVHAESRWHFESWLFDPTKGLDNVWRTGFMRRRGSLVPQLETTRWPDPAYDETWDDLPGGYHHSRLAKVLEALDNVVGEFLLLGEALSERRATDGDTADLEAHFPNYVLPDRHKLVQVLHDRFNDGELKQVCFELDLLWENLPGESHGDKARELYLYCERHDQVVELVTAVRRHRPRAVWWQSWL